MHCSVVFPALEVGHVYTRLKLKVFIGFWSGPLLVEPHNSYFVGNANSVICTAFPF